jgi:16S rRNA (cytosine967-C5)-methyltransferase
MSKSAGTSSSRSSASCSAEGGGGQPPQTLARAVAARVLARVWHERAFAAPTLDAELRRQPGLDPRDVGLATELVYGILRTGPWLEQLVARHASRGDYKRRPLVRAQLLIAAYSMAFLRRIPAYAAVSEAVEGIRSASDERVARFANAVLRRVAADLEVGAPLTLADALAAGLPAWLHAALNDALGADEAGRFLRSVPVPPPLGICLRAGEDRAAWIERLRLEAPGATIDAGAVSPRCIRTRGAGDPRRLPGSDVAWIVQEEGAQAVALCAGGRAGESVLDACAGRGGKAFLLADAVGPTGAVDAADLATAKLRRLGDSGIRAGLVRQSYAVDWTRGTGDVPCGYDRALVDAPCSGLGTIGRRPEIGQRLEPSDVARLGALQQSIVRQVASRVRTGGRLIYAVCSVLRQETDEVVDALTKPARAAPERLAPAPFDGELGQRCPRARAVFGCCRSSTGPTAISWRASWSSGARTRPPATRWARSPAAGASPACCRSRRWHASAAGGCREWPGSRPSRIPPRSSAPRAA